MVKQRLYSFCMVFCAINFKNYIEALQWRSYICCSDAFHNRPYTTSKGSSSFVGVPYFTAGNISFEISLPILHLMLPYRNISFESSLPLLHLIIPYIWNGENAASYCCKTTICAILLCRVFLRAHSHLILLYIWNGEKALEWWKKEQATAARPLFVLSYDVEFSGV